MIEGTITFNSLTLNDRAKAALATSPFYWYEVTSIDGFWDPEVELEEFPIAGTDGTRMGDSLYRSRTITLTGRIWARNFRDLRIAQSALIAAFDKDQHNMTFLLHGFPSIYLKARKSQPVSMPESQVDLRVMRPFVVSVRAADPSFYNTVGDTPYSFS